MMAGMAIQDFLFPLDEGGNKPKKEVVDGCAGHDG